MSRGDIQLSSIQAARERIRGNICPLCITRSSSLSQQFESDILLAHEYLQITGSFKLRGAVGIAALLAGKVKSGHKTIVLLSGKGIDMNLQQKII